MRKLQGRTQLGVTNVSGIPLPQGPGFVGPGGDKEEKLRRSDPTRSVNSILQCGRQQKSVSQKSVNSARADRDDVIEAAVVEKSAVLDVLTANTSNEAMD